jgi:hypothetical protein
LSSKPIAITNKIRQGDPLLSANCAEIKENLDPSFSYLVFEKAASKGKEYDFEEIVASLSPFNKMIRKYDIYQDKSGSRCLLAVQLRLRHKNKIVPEIMNMKLPKDMIFYIYGRRLN